MFLFKQILLRLILRNFGEILGYFFTPISGHTAAPILLQEKAKILDVVGRRRARGNGTLFAAINGSRYLRGKCKEGWVGGVNDDKSSAVAARETAVIDSRYLKAYLRSMRVCVYLCERESVGQNEKEREKERERACVVIDHHARRLVKEPNGFVKLNKFSISTYGAVLKFIGNARQDPKMVSK